MSNQVFNDMAKIDHKLMSEALQEGGPLSEEIRGKISVRYSAIHRDMLREWADRVASMEERLMAPE